MAFLEEKLMEWSLLVVMSTSTQPRRFPFEVGRQWLAGRYESGIEAVGPAGLHQATSIYSVYNDEKCYIPLPDSHINRWHCHFCHEHEGAWLEDLKSIRGTFLNGEQTLGKCPLHLDDVISIANCKIFVTGTATINPAWLAWENGAVVELAAEIHKTRDFARLPILGDRLQNAGCTDIDILNHCLDQHKDPQRCCVLDLLLEPQSP